MTMTAAPKSRASDDFPGGMPERRIPCLPAGLDPVLGQRPDRPVGRCASLVSGLIVHYTAPPAHDFPFPQVQHAHLPAGQPGQFVGRREHPLGHR